MSEGRSHHGRGSHNVRGPSWAVLVGAALAVGLVVVVVGALLRGSGGGSAPTLGTSAAPLPSALGSSAAAELVGQSGQRLAPEGSLPTAAAKDLAAAIAAARPHMKDTTDRLDEGAASLALWAIENLRWSALVALPETSPLLFRKDPDEERGRLLCAEGVIREVRAERNLGRRLESDHSLPLPAAEATATSTGGRAGGADFVALEGHSRTWEAPNGKVFFAVIDTAPPGAGSARPTPDVPAPLVVSALLVGSTAALVDGDRTRVCGVLTGVNLIRTRSGSDLLAHRVVGMLDLPENRP